MGRLTRSFLVALPPSLGGGRHGRPPPPLLALTTAVCVLVLLGVARRSPPSPPQLPPSSRLARAPRGGIWPRLPPPSAGGWNGPSRLVGKAKGWPSAAGEAKGWPPLVGSRHGVAAVDATPKGGWGGAAGAAHAPTVGVGGRGGEGRSPVAAGPSAPPGGHAPGIPGGADGPASAMAVAVGGAQPGDGSTRPPAGTGGHADGAPSVGTGGEAGGGGVHEGATAVVLAGDDDREAIEDAADGAPAVNGGEGDRDVPAAPAFEGGDADAAAADAPATGGPGPVVALSARDAGHADGVTSGGPAVDGPQLPVTDAAAAGEGSRGVGGTIGAAAGGSAAGGLNGSVGGGGTDGAMNLVAPVAAGTAAAGGALAPPPTALPPGPPITLTYCPEDWAVGAVQALAAALPGTLTATPAPALPAGAPAGGHTAGGAPDRLVTVFVRSAWGHCTAPAAAAAMVFIDMEPRSEPLTPPPGVVIVSGTDLWGGGASAAAAAAAAAAPHLHVPYALVSLGQREGVGAADLARPPGWVPPPPVTDAARFGVWDVEGCGPDARAAGGAAPPGHAAAAVAYDVISSRYKRLATVGGCHSPPALPTSASGAAADGGSPGGEREAAVARLRGHKFALVAERSALPGFVSERVVDAYLAGVVPVYVGGPRDGGRYLNPAAVIRCGPGPAGDWAACLAAIAALDGDAAAHAAAVAAPLYAPGGGRVGGWARWDTHAARLVRALRALPGVGGGGGGEGGAPAASAPTA